MCPLHTYYRPHRGGRAAPNAINTTRRAAVTGRGGPRAPLFHHQVDREVVVYKLDDDRAGIVSTVNNEFADIAPGFGANDGTPVLVTPAAAPAAAAFVLGSGICLAC
jgi:hypothetical protein